MFFFLALEGLNTYHTSLVYFIKGLDKKNSVQNSKYFLTHNFSICLGAQKNRLIKMFFLVPTTYVWVEKYENYFSVTHS